MFSTSIKGVTPNSFQSLDINDKQRDYDYCVSMLAFIYFFIIYSMTLWVRVTQIYIQWEIIYKI